MAKITTEVQRSDYVQASFGDSNDWLTVISRADSFMSYFQSDEVRERITE